MSDRTKIFISYSHDDERWRKRLVSHLAVLAMEGILDLWDDRRLGAGDDWYARIHEQMLSARIAVLLVSSSFLTSKFIRQEEVPKLFDRHEQGGMTVYPLLVKPCPWQEVAWLARMQLRPLEARPLASFKGAKVDEILVEVAREISAMAKSKAASISQPVPRRSGSVIEEPPANDRGQFGVPPLGGSHVPPAEAGTPNGNSQAGSQAAPTVPDISGEWRAEVIYDWDSAKYAEVFHFTVDGDEVLGTASFLTAKQAIWDGKLAGNKLTFVTKTRQTCGDWNNEREQVHHYRGKVSQDEIRFVMQSEGGFTQHVPIEFTARRTSANRDS
jgi:hypothetical protein